MAEIYVTSTADSGAGSLRQAIADAQDGDVILFDADVFPAGETTSILLSSYITINKSVSIYGGFSDGAGGYTSGATKRYYVYRDIDNVKTKVYIDDNNPATEGETVLFENVCRVALDGQEAVRQVYLNSTEGAVTQFCGISFKNGFSTVGGGCCFAGSSAGVIFKGCDFIDCVAANGGGIYSASTSQSTLNDCTFYGCTATNGGGVYSANTSQNTLNGCVIDGCNATSNGGGVYSTNTSQNTLNGCIVDGCSASNNGGGVYSTSASQNSLNDCTITGCTATSYCGGLRSADTSKNTLNNCIFDSCTAKYGGAINSISSSQNTLNGCTITNCSAVNNAGGILSVNTSQNTLNGCTITDNTSDTAGREGVVLGDSSILNSNNSVVDHLYVGMSAILNITNNITTVGSALFGRNAQGVAATVMINDGAALTLPDSANVAGATFTSSGRGYLAVGAGINVSAATLTNVVLCAYGADVSSFVEVDGVLEWDAANPTTTVLIERADGDSWTTVTQTAGESLTLYLPPSDTVRLFDGVQFFTAQAPDVRTYYYIGGAEGSFTSAADWSLRRGGVAITEPPVVAGQRFIVGDIAEEEQGS